MDMVGVYNWSGRHNKGKGVYQMRSVWGTDLFPRGYVIYEEVGVT